MVRKLKPEAFANNSCDQPLSLRKCFTRSGDSFVLLLGFNFFTLRPLSIKNSATTLLALAGLIHHQK